MTLHRFHVSQLVAGRISLGPEESAHAHRVLRLRPGDAVALFDGKGGRADGKIAEVARSARETVVMVEAGAPRFDAPSKHVLRIIVAACKRDRLEWLVEKCSELGVTEIAICEFARSVARASESKLEKLERTCLEACKQCGRAWLPALSLHVSPMAAMHGSVQALLADPSPAAKPILAVLCGVSRDRSSLQVVIGPEGGITDDEHAKLIGKDAIPVRMAGDVLRTETAAVAAAAIWSAWQCDNPVQSSP